MGPSKKSVTERIRYFIEKVASDNLFLLSSSISYYSALALAPFMLILLWVASLLGQDVQGKIIQHATENFSSQVGELIRMVFNNVNEGVDVGSVSGIIGFSVLLWTCSLVFLQFRFAFDVIHGHYDPDFSRSWGEIIRERIFSMLIVLAAAILVIFSFTMVAVVDYAVAPESGGAVLYRTLVFLLNFLIYLGIFTMIHYFTPSRRKKLPSVVKVAFLTSLFFVLGNSLLATYLRTYAGRSVYGAAGTLLVFLIWSYYSSFTVLLSVEVSQCLGELGKARQD